MLSNITVDVVSVFRLLPISAKKVSVVSEFNSFFIETENTKTSDSRMERRHVSLELPIGHRLARTSRERLLILVVRILALIVVAVGALKGSPTSPQFLRSRTERKMESEAPDHHHRFHHRHQQRVTIGVWKPEWES